MDLEDAYHFRKQTCTNAHLSISQPLVFGALQCCPAATLADSSMKMHTKFLCSRFLASKVHPDPGSVAVVECKNPWTLFVWILAWPQRRGVAWQHGILCQDKIRKFFTLDIKQYPSCPVSEQRLQEQLQHLHGLVSSWTLELLQLSTNIAWVVGPSGRTSLWLRDEEIPQICIEVFEYQKSSKLPVFAQTGWHHKIQQFVIPILF